MRWYNFWELVGAIDEVFLPVLLRHFYRSANAQVIASILTSPISVKLRPDVVFARRVPRSIR